MATVLLPGLSVLIALTPLIALLSGMAMTPLLLIMAALIALNAHYLRRLHPLWSSECVFALGIVGLLLLWPLLSVVWSIAPERTLTSALRVALLMVIGASAFLYCHRIPRLNERMILYLAGCMVFCALLMTAELLSGRGVLRSSFIFLGLDYDRFVLKNVNRGFCVLAVLIWPIVAALYGRGRKLLALALPMVLAIPTGAYNSLSAWVGLLSGAVSFVLLMAWPRVMAKLIAIVIPIFFTIWPAVFPFLDRYLFSLPAVYENLPDSAQHRVEIWRFTLDKALERPILGWGFEASRFIPGGDVVYMGARKYLPMHPHNSALQILLEQGAIGFFLACLALMFVTWLWRNMKMESMARAASGAAMISYLAVGFSAFGLWQYWWLAVAWITGIIWVLINLQQPNKENMF